MIPMQDEKDAQVKQALRAEIEALQNYYVTLKEYIAGKEYDSIEIAATLQVFKESLNRISSHILTLYVLNKQKTKITWEPFLENLDNATATTRAAKGNIRSAIELAFSISEPNAQEVMAYLAKLKESLQ
jgi:hypothetical protein